MRYFDSELRVLLARWSHYEDMPRDPDDLRPLAAAREALDEARWRVAVEREVMEAHSSRSMRRRVGPRFDVDPDKLAALHVRGRSPGSFGG